MDPDGQMSAFLDLIAPMADPPAWLNQLTAGTLDELKDLSKGHQRLLKATAEALELLGARGWAVINMNTNALEQACDLVREGQGAEADELLALEWDEDWRIPRVCDRVDVMGAGEPEYHRLFQERARLLRKACHHHKGASYEASVPLVLAQIEGIVMDVTGGKAFFSRHPGRQADVVDPNQLVSIAASLAAVRRLYTSSVPQTQSAGELSRHGILHGRELAYDTKVISAKCWSLIDAVVQWALPLARAETDRRRVERQALTAGSPDVDQDGRRVDDREFSATRDVLRLLGTSQMGWHRQRGQFRADLIGTVYDAADFVKRGLPRRHGVQMKVSADGQAMWAWRETASGWIFGLAIVAQSDSFGEWLYAGNAEPTASPIDDPAEWGGQPWQIPPDWRPR